MKVDGETYGIHETRLANLGKGRGRVRRIAVLTPEGYQINLLAIAEEKKERLLEVMLGRWIQENGFKHGNERWGITHGGKGQDPFKQGLEAKEQAAHLRSGAEQAAHLRSGALPAPVTLRRSEDL